MPGICGYVARNGHCRVDSWESTVDGLSVDFGCSREEWRDPQQVVILRSFSLGGEAKIQTKPISDSRSVSVAFDGEFYSQQVHGQMDDGQRQKGAAPSNAGDLLAGFQRQGITFVRDQHGSFSAAIWDGNARKLTLLTDRFGTRPLYYHVGPTGLIFASSLQSVLAGVDGQARVSPRGLAQFFTFGHYLRNDTSIENVFVLPAAAVFEYWPDTGELKQGTYWSSTDDLPPMPTDRRELLEQIDVAFTKAVARRTKGASELGMSLSGGLDARSILAVISPDLARIHLQTVCLGVSGSRDHRSAARLASLAGCRHHSHVLKDDFLADFQSHLEQMVRLTDGQYLSQCIVMPTLPLYRRLGIRFLLRGHAGELMHMRKAYSYSLDDGALQIRSNAQVQQWLFKKLQARMLEGITQPLFAPQYQQNLQELAAASMNEDIADVAMIDPPLKQIWHLFLSQRLRRETALSMLKFRSVVEPRLPFMDNDLIPLLLAAPPDLKLDEEIQTYILRKHRPEFLGVTNTNTGTRVGAGAWQRKLSTFRMKVLAKLRMPGYQPYERLGPWLRSELAPMVRRILLEPRTLDRGVFEPDGVRAVVHQHLEQGRNHTYLLMALMIFELGLRRLADSQSESATSTQPLGVM